MNFEKWPRIEELYHLAQAWEAGKREALLKEACAGDEELYREVESLLAAGQLQISVLDHPLDSEPPAAPLVPGTQIGAYRVEARIGEGGMGVVYRAFDTRLNRTVAIKLIANELSDREARLRFQREARMASSLNHPHILTVFDAGEFEGRQYLVTEFIDQGTLRDWAKTERRSWRQIVELLVGVADGLAAAHTAGVLHRDIKPDNILVAKNGYAKLVDFGLAKLIERAPGSAVLSLASHATKAGVITGTILYMSPEQASGKPVDERSDIFSFGIVLYEMLAGRRPFSGATVLEQLETLIHQVPAALPEEIPQSLRMVVEKALEKDPVERYQSMREMVVDLRRLLRQKSETRLPASRSESSWRSASFSMVWLAIAVAAIAFAMAIYLHRSPPVDSLETRLEINNPPTNDPRSFALSPDGRWLAYVALVDGQSRLWLRRLDSTTAQPLAITESGAAYPFWSPDSRSIGFFSGSKLKRIGVGGGLPQTVADAPSGRGGSWSTDGVILFAPTPATSLFRVSASGGDGVAVTKLESWSNNHRFPQFLPDGRHFLFYVEGTPEKPNNIPSGAIYLGSLDGGTKKLTDADTASLYMPLDWLLWVRAGKLVASRFDLERGELTGDLVTVADSVFFDTSHARLFSVSTTGLVAYRQGTPTVQLTWFDRSGKALGVFAVPADNDEKVSWAPHISPDGRRVAIVRRVHDTNDIWLLDDSHASRFTFGGGGNPVWSPDGSRIAFQSSRFQSPRNEGERGQGTPIFAKPSDATQDETPLVDLPQRERGVGVDDWSPAGRFLIYGTNSTQTGYDLWAVSLEGNRKPWIFLQTKFDEKYSRFSPDGRWVAYASNESGRSEIYIRAFADPAVPRRTDSSSGQWQISLSGGLFPAWRRDGRELYWVGPDSRMMAATITETGKTLKPGAPVALFQTRIYGGGLDVNTGGMQFDVASDGRFLINTIVDNASSSITVLQNWRPPVK